MCQLLLDPETVSGWNGNVLLLTKRSRFAIEIGLIVEGGYLILSNICVSKAALPAPKDVIAIFPDIQLNRG